MATPRKLSVAFARFPYGGVGASSLEVPDIGDWLCDTALKCKGDPRIEWTKRFRVSDTPITMTRNKAVRKSQGINADVLVMLDSDMCPDCELLGDASAKPFWETSFDFLYKHWEKGPVIIAAPYCGPPPYSNTYVFRWAQWSNHLLPQDMRIEMYGREEAAMRSGIQGGEVAALPTGCIMYDMRIFDYLEPPWFYYEWKNKFQDEKASTEDVTMTRDACLRAQLKLGYNPLHINWDAWAGHWKPFLVRKPRPITVEEVGQRYTNAVKDHFHRDEREITVGECKMLTPQQEAETDAALARMAQRDEKRNAWQRVIDSGACSASPDDCRVLAELCSLAQRPGEKLRVVEIGSFSGNSAKAVVAAVNGQCEMWCVDTWRGTTNDTSGKFVDTLVRESGNPEVMFEIFKQNVGDLLGHEILAVHATSLDAASRWEAGKLDLVFIDADHSYEAVRADIQAWIRHVRPGGIIAGHDYGGEPRFPGVKKAVEELLPDHSVINRVWWHRVPETAHANGRLNGRITKKRSKKAKQGA